MGFYWITGRNDEKGAKGEYTTQTNIKKPKTVQFILFSIYGLIISVDITFYRYNTVQICTTEFTLNMYFNH